MLPDGVLSAVVQEREIMYSRGYADDIISAKNYLIDYEDGGIGLNDASEGLFYQMWTGIVYGGTDITLKAPNTPTTTIITGVEITELSFTFDQNMKPSITYVDQDISKLYWYDTTISAYAIAIIDGTSPKIFHDDKRLLQRDISDVVLFYIRDSTLFMRVQRDRFLVEYSLKTGLAVNRIKCIGMGKNWRVQIKMFNS